MAFHFERNKKLTCGHQKLLPLLQLKWKSWNKNLDENVHGWEERGNNSKNFNEKNIKDLFLDYRTKTTLAYYIDS